MEVKVFIHGEGIRVVRNGLKHVWRVLCYPALYMLIQYAMLLVYSVVISYASFFQYFPNTQMSRVNMDRLMVRHSAELAALYETMYNPMIAAILYSVVTIGVMIALMRKKWRWDMFWRARKMGAVPFAECALLGAGLRLLISVWTFIGASGAQARSVSVWGVLTDVLAACVFVPLVEELIFRETVYNRLKAFMRPLAAALTQAVIYGALYMDVRQGLYGFAIGVVLALVYEKYRSIWAVFVIHASFNGFSLLVSYTLAGGSFGGGYLAGASTAALLMIFFAARMIFTKTKNPLRKA